MTRPSNQPSNGPLAGRSASRGFCLSLAGALGFAAILGACGPEPEPETAAKPPTPTATAKPTATVPTAPAEPTPEEHKAKAKAAFEAKDYAKAKVELGAVVAKNPSDIEANKMLGDVFSAEGDAKGATDAYYAAAKADGGKDEPLALVAALGLHGQKRFDDEIGLMQLTTKSHEKSMPAWMYLALAQTAKGDYASAAETYGKLTVAFPDEPQHWAHLAVAQSAAGKNDEAKKTAKSALDKWLEVRDPKKKKDVTLGKGADEIAMIARAMRRAGDPNGAIAALGKYAVPKDETAPFLDFERGMAKRAKKDVAGAKAEADKLQKAKGESWAPLQILLAGIAADSKKPDEAKAHLAEFDKRMGNHYGLVLDAKAIEASLAAPVVAPKK
jgi:Tfp pilus assembly protein PilF